MSVYMEHKLKWDVSIPNKVLIQPKRFSMARKSAVTYSTCTGCSLCARDSVKDARNGCTAVNKKWLESCPHEPVGQLSLLYCLYCYEYLL